MINKSFPTAALLLLLLPWSSVLASTLSSPQPPTRPTSRPHEERRGRGQGREEEKAPATKKRPKPRPGIPVTDALVIKHCSSCHKTAPDGTMSRISQMRKTPEGWELSIKRMVRHHHLQITPEEARSMVRYLANRHGLARKEAQRALYEAERRVHWSEEEQDKELRQTCAVCHTLGRVLSQQRDTTEWKRLKSTHLAFFPLANFQAFRGRREGRRGPPGERGRSESRRGPDRADKVLGRLAERFPLFTPEWKAWEVNRREVPLAGTWFVKGHERSRGDIRGSVEITRTGPDAYATTWELHYGDGAVVRRSGKGLLYAGYSWRGRSRPLPGTPAGEPEQLREVLLLDEDWNRFQGRIFTGGYNELGMDVELFRVGPAPAIFAVDEAAIMAPSESHTLTVHGCGFPSDLKAEDFDLGQGISVKNARRVSLEEVRLEVAVRADAEIGRRRISFRTHIGPDAIVLYDTVDYIKILPERGFARVGGKAHPKQLERFEVWGMHQGEDGRPYTSDDFPIKLVRARFSLEEFPVREDDDDVRFVGVIDPETGVFTPALDGPNPKRKWRANNIGDVYVVAECTLRVPERPPAAKEGEEADGKPSTRPAKAALGPPVERSFRARGHLLVTVPIYVRYDRLEWDQR